MRSVPLDGGDPTLELRRVRTDRLDAVFVPSVGGRLISLRVDGVELLWRDPALLDDDFRWVRPSAEWPEIDGTFASWTNLGGSKTWPAPQGWDGPDEWPGPPDAVLDAGAWTWAEESDGDELRVVLTSADDARTGLRIERSFAFRRSDLGMAERIRLTNTSERPVTWAPWEICQVAATPAADGRRGTVEVAVEPGSPVVGLGDYHGRLDVRSDGDRVVVPLQDVVAKRGFPGARGSISWRAPSGEGLAFRFEPVVAAVYPDAGSRAEVWMQAPLDAPLPELGGLHPRVHLVEIEVLGPLRTLAPGHSTDLAIDWTVTPRSA